MFVLESRLRLLLLMLARWWSEAHLLVEKTLARNDEAIQAAATDSACGWNTDDVIISFYCLPCCHTYKYVLNCSHNERSRNSSIVFYGFHVTLSLGSSTTRSSMNFVHPQVSSRWKESDLGHRSIKPCNSLFIIC